MSSALLKSVVRKNKIYKDWKSTTDNNKYLIKQVNFKTYGYILKNVIEKSKPNYNFDTFSAKNNYMKKHGLNRFSGTIYISREDDKRFKGHCK